MSRRRRRRSAPAFPKAAEWCRRIEALRTAVDKAVAARDEDSLAELESHAATLAALADEVERDGDAEVRRLMGAASMSHGFRAHEARQQLVAWQKAGETLSYLEAVLERQAGVA